MSEDLDKILENWEPLEIAEIVTKRNHLKLSTVFIDPKSLQQVIDAYSLNDPEKFKLAKLLQADSIKLTENEFVQYLKYDLSTKSKAFMPWKL